MIRTGLAIIILCSLLPALNAQQIFTTKTGNASFVSDAPLELIKASSDELYGAVNLDERTFVFTISNKSFTGFNSPLQQEHFYENYMEIQQYPSSTFQGKFIENIDPVSDQEQVVRAKGILNIHGVEQERIIRGTIRIKDNTAIIRAEFTVPLEDHGIKIPRVVYQKIAEVIDIKIEAELKRK